MTRFLASIALLIGANLAVAGGLTLSMSIEPEEVKAGSSPVFIVTFTNTSSSPIRILDFSARGDLQAAYLPVAIRSGLRTVELPRTIADPGPISDSAYRSIGPHKSHVVRLERLPVAVNQLKPGEYTASVEYREPASLVRSVTAAASAPLIVRQ